MVTVVTGNFKGGVGKTTTSVNLAYCFSEMGKKTLLIDGDPQTNSTPFYKRNVTDNKTIKEAIDNPERIMDYITPTKYPNLDVLGGCRDLIGETLDNNQITWLSVAKEQLENIYDICLIDTNPDLSPLTVSALIAADVLLTPIELNMSCRDNLSLLEEKVDELIEANGLVWKVFAMGVDLRRKSQKNALTDIVEKHNYPFLENYISSSADVNNAWDLYKPVPLHRSKSIVTEEFRALARELLGSVEV